MGAFWEREDLQGVHWGVWSTQTSSCMLFTRRTNQGKQNLTIRSYPKLLMLTYADHVINGLGLQSGLSDRDRL